ncbi:MAG: HD-GYP domain-containing protein [Oligoflexus sp.]
MSMMERKSTSVTSIQHFKPIKLTDLKNPVTRFDLYLDIAGRAVLYAPGPYTWSDAEKNRLIHDGHVVLFYDPSHHAFVDEYLHSAPVHLSSLNLEDSVNISPISDMAAEFSQMLYQISNQTNEMIIVKNLAHTLVQSVLEYPKTLHQLGELANHDSFTFYHSARVAAYSVAVAQKMGISDEEDLADIALGCILHDLGHLKIDQSLLDKPGPLTEREWSIMRQHPEWSWEMVENLNLNFVTTEIILHHHERSDGKGYPHGISGSELLKEVRIVTVCDVFDALTSARSYQERRTPRQAIEFIRQIASDYLDPDALTALEDLAIDMSAPLSKTS